MVMSEEPVYKVKVLYCYAQNGTQETGVRDLEVKVCPRNDPDCLSPLPPQHVHYGADNYLVITGLTTGNGYRIRLKAKHPTKPDVELMPGEFAMYRSVVGETVEPKPILMFEEAVRDSLARVAGVEVDPSLGMFLTRVFDCSNTEVAGVSISVDKNVTGCGGACSTRVFYQDTVNQPDVVATETNSAGRGGIVNMQTDVFNHVTITRTADQQNIASFAITPKANSVTYVHFYPWDYGTSVE